MKSKEINNEINTAKLKRDTIAVITCSTPSGNENYYLIDNVWCNRGPSAYLCCDEPTSVLLDIILENLLQCETPQKP